MMAELSEKPDFSAPLSVSKILLAADFSPAGDVALRYAVAFARQFHARVFLTHVLTDLDSFGRVDLTSPEHEALNRKAYAKLAVMAESQVMQGISSEVLIATGYLWETLEDTIRKRSIDLVIAGTKGKPPSGTAETTAEVIYRNAECAVLTVGPVAAKNAPATPAFKKILFATDFALASEHAARHAFFLASQCHATLTLLHVIGSMGHHSKRIMDAMLEVTRVRLAESTPPGMQGCCKVEQAIEVGDSADRIIDYARRTAPDLLVMGAKTGKALVTHLPHSDTFTVSAAGPCPILTVKG